MYSQYAQEIALGLEQAEKYNKKAAGLNIMQAVKRGIDEQHILGNVPGAVQLSVL